MSRDTELKLQAIYLNSRQHMKNTMDDWEKVLDAFQKVIRESWNDPEVVREALKYYNMLEVRRKEVQKNDKR